MMLRMGDILVGTASWTDPTLLKSGWYPPGADSAEERLKFYSTQFPLVEVDSTYYFPPSEKNSELWDERTPDNFVFNIKAYSLLTQHPTKVESLYKDLERPADKKRVISPISNRRRSTRCGTGSFLLSTRCTRPASSVCCCSSSRIGFRSDARTAITSSNVQSEPRRCRFASSSVTPPG